MNWTALTTEEQLAALNAQSTTQPVIIFKHSTRCSISSMAKNRIEKIAENGSAAFYYLDLLNYRPISGKIAEDYHVHHESPQVLLIVNGECVYEETHNGITAQDIEAEVKEWSAKMGTASLS